MTFNLDQKFTSLTLNGKQFSGGELLTFSENMLLSESVPGWQKKIYLFIQEWLSREGTIKSVTSGTTGPPKTIWIEKSAMIKSANRTGDFLQLKKGDSALLCLPVDFIAGKMMIVRSFVLGLDLHFINPSSKPLKEMDCSYEFAAMTPMQVHYTLAESRGIDKLNNIKTLIIGGGDMAPALRSEVRVLSNNTFQTYGMTETITHIAMKKISGSLDELHYTTLPGVEIDKDKNDCLIITDQVLGLDKLITNDVVEIYSKSAFRFLGRFDHVINSGGIKIIPEEVEYKLSKVISNRLMIAGVKDNALGEKLVLIIETGRLGFPKDLESKIQNLALDKYEFPKDIVGVPSFPETENGKIMRSELLTWIATEIE